MVPIRFSMVLLRDSKPMRILAGLSRAVTFGLRRACGCLSEGAAPDRG